LNSPGGVMSTASPTLPGTGILASAIDHPQITDQFKVVR
jgi:hypothetical protein